MRERKAKGEREGGREGRARCSKLFRAGAAKRSDELRKLRLITGHVVHDDARARGVRRRGDDFRFEQKARDYARNNNAERAGRCLRGTERGALLVAQ